jgi:hypothetical protein
MKYPIYVLLALALIASASASVVDPVFTSGWAGCEYNALNAGGYGGISPGACWVAWDGVYQPCTEGNRDATFTVGTDGMTTTEISINHLDGTAETADSFAVMDGNDELCRFDDITSGTEIWRTLTCDVEIDGVKTLTLHPLATGPWSSCDTYGQVAIHSITFEAEEDNDVPEFGLIAGSIALIGVVAGAFFLRKK